MLHLSFRLWFFLHCLKETFIVKWIRWNEPARKPPNHYCDERKKKRCLTSNKMTWRWRRLKKKKLTKYTNRTKKKQQEIATLQTNTKQCRQRKKKQAKIQNTNAINKRERIILHRKGQKRGKQVTFLLLRLFFILWTHRFSFQLMLKAKI